jgi:hypothetical protein
MDCLYRVVHRISSHVYEVEHLAHGSQETAYISKLRGTAALKDLTGSEEEIDQVHISL